MKRLLKNLLAKRFVWFLIGLSIIPGFWGLRVFVRPTAKDAMGFVGFYEENQFIYTFLGDHSYSLGFPGDKKKFETYAKRLGLSQHKVSDSEYREEDPNGQWEHGVIFDPEDELRAIRYFSSSQ